MSNTSIAASLQKATVIYRAEAGQVRQVWSNVNIDIRAGEWIVVAGPNGSGKSTLAGVLLGLCPLSDGQLIRGAGEQAVTRGVLQIPDAQFVGDTVEEELQHVPQAPDLAPEARAELYAEALGRVGLSLPPGRTLSSLSGGQKQLLNIAAALAAKPDLLVLDEPTAMLDPAARQEVLRAVRQAHARGTTIVWITHRLEEAAEAGRVLAFHGGRVAFDGPPRDFFYGEASEADKGSSEASGESALSPCERLGLEPPFVVRTALLLRQRGLRLDPLPLHADELAEAVNAG